MSEPFIDETGTAPGFGSLVPLLSNSFMHTWECDYEENLPLITQNPDNGIEWTLEWCRRAFILSSQYHNI